MARLVKASLGFATGVTKTVVITVVGFAVTPIVLHFLGDEQFAAYRMLIDWFGLPGVITGAIFASLSGAASNAITKNDWASARVCVVDGLRRSFFLGFVIAGAGLVLMAAIDVLIPTKSTNVANLRLAALLFAVKSLLLPAYVFRVVIEADQRSYWINLWEIGRSVVYGLSAAAFAYLAWGVAGQALALSLGELVVIVALCVAGLKTFPGILQELKKGGVRTNVGTLFGAALVVSLSVKLAQATDNLIVGLVAGTEQVTGFFLTQRLVVLVSTFVVLISGSSWAGLLQLHNQGEEKLFGQRLVESTHLVSGVCWITLVPTLLFNEAFIAAWVGPAQYDGLWVGVLAAINAWLINVFGLWSWLINGKGKVQDWAPYAVLIAVTNVAISVGLTYRLGPVGALLGTTAGLLFVYGWAVSRLMRRHFAAPIGAMVWALVKPMVWGVPLYFIVRWSPLGQWRSNNLFEILGVIGLLSFVGMLLNWFTVMSVNERRQWLERAQIMLRWMRKPR